MEPFNVLITGAGTTNAVTVLKGIKAMNNPLIRVLMGDIQPDCAGPHLGDEFVCMPSAGDPFFEERVIEMCRKRCIDLVVPMIDYEFASWSRITEELRAAGTRVIISPPHVINQCAQKDFDHPIFSQGRRALPTYLANQ